MEEDRQRENVDEREFGNRALFGKRWSASGGRAELGYRQSGWDEITVGLVRRAFRRGGSIPRSQPTWTKEDRDKEEKEERRKSRKERKSATYCVS